MDQDASPDGLIFLVEIACQSAEDCRTEHHGKFISHVDYEEEQSGHPDSEMLVVLFAGSGDVVLNDTLNEDLLEHRTDGIEPAHICTEIKSEPGLLSVTRYNDILNQTYGNETDDEAHGDYAANYEVILDSLLAGI